MSSQLPIPVPGSFRDPSGRVYQLENEIFRTVSLEFSSEFEFVESTGFFDKACREKLLLSFDKVTPDWFAAMWPEVKYVLKAPMLPMVSFPYEWPFLALKEAALLHLKLQLMALDFEVTLSDASAYNVQFQGSQAIFIDHLSFRQYREGEIWVGHRQFCEQFLLPLLMRAFFGITPNAWYRGGQEGITATDFKRLLGWRHYLNINVLTHIVLPASLQRSTLDKSLSLEKGSLAQAGLPKSSFKRMLQKLYKWIEPLAPADTGKTVWKDYAHNHSYSTEEVEIKKQFIAEFVREAKPGILWDLGCNTGDYSVAAMEAGAGYVVGLDFDLGALDLAFSRSKESHLPFQVLFMDAANPSPNQGWKGTERQSLASRAKGNALIALALIHHLAISRNIPLEDALDWLMSLAPMGVIEFVPKEDAMVKKLLSCREDIFPFYTEESCLTFIRSKGKVIKTVKTSQSGRLLIWYSRT